jgi:hypothetical protein
MGVNLGINLGVDLGTNMDVTLDDTLGFGWAVDLKFRRQAIAHGGRVARLGPPGQQLHAVS